MAYTNEPIGAGLSESSAATVVTNKRIALDWIVRRIWILVLIPRGKGKETWIGADAGISIFSWDKSIWYLDAVYVEHLGSR